MCRCRAEHIEQLQHLTAVHRAVLSTANTLRAVTVTANAKLVSKARCQGLQVVSVLHHAVWLTGF